MDVEWEKNDETKKKKTSGPPRSSSNPFWINVPPFIRMMMAPGCRPLHLKNGDHVCIDCDHGLLDVPRKMYLAGLRNLGPLGSECLLILARNLHVDSSKKKMFAPLLILTDRLSSDPSREKPPSISTGLDAHSPDSSHPGSNAWICSLRWAWNTDLGWDAWSRSSRPMVQAHRNSGFPSIEKN